MREREIAALYRAIEMAASQPVKPTRAPSKNRASASTIDTTEKPAKPLREKQRIAEGKKRIMIRSAPGQKKGFDEYNHEDEKRKKRIDELRDNANHGYYQ
jgi:hypothetical protein